MEVGTEQKTTRVQFVQQVDSQNTTTNTTTDDEEVFAGLDATQILIIFLIIAFGLIIVFLMFYYCSSRKQKSSNRRGSSRKPVNSNPQNDDRSHNMVAHPERQVATDQPKIISQSPSSTSQQSEPEQIAEQPTNLTPQAPIAQVEPSKPPNDSDPPSIKVVPKQSEATQVKTIPKQVDTSLKKKSNSNSKKERNRMAEPYDIHHSMVGTLAGLRDTLKESDSH